MEFVCLGPASSLPTLLSLFPTIFAVKPRPPAQVTGCPFFLIKAAELKRFRTHPLRMYTLSIQRWVGGRSSKLRAESLLTKMATARLYTLTLPPTGTCQIVQFTPLRSVYHHNCPVGDQQAARPESKLWWSAAPLPSLRVSPVGQQRHCHTVRSMVTFFFFPSAKHLAQSPSWRSPEAFSCNNPRARPAPSNCALALIPVMCWARTLTSSRIWVTWAIYSSPATLSESEV